MPVARVGDDKAALAITGHKPIFAADHARIATARDPDVGIVLLRAVNVIGKRVINRDMIKLRRRLIV